MRLWLLRYGQADFDLAFDEVIRLAGRDIGLIGVERHPDRWFLDKLYLLPACQNRGIGGYLLQRLIDDAKAARVPLRLTVLEINPARRFHERQGFIVTHTIPPRHHMEWHGRSASFTCHRVHKWTCSRLTLPWSRFRLRKLDVSGPLLPSPGRHGHGGYLMISCRQRRLSATVEDDPKPSSSSG
jgi:N-acetylglutamate synthase-like GNAT family acetyltransferase